MATFDDLSSEDISRLTDQEAIRAAVTALVAASADAMTRAVLGVPDAKARAVKLATLAKRIGE